MQLRQHPLTPRLLDRSLGEARWESHANIPTLHKWNKLVSVYRYSLSSSEVSLVGKQLVGALLPASVVISFSVRFICCAKNSWRILDIGTSLQHMMRYDPLNSGIWGSFLDIWENTATQIFSSFYWKVNHIPQNAHHTKSKSVPFVILERWIHKNIVWTVFLFCVLFYDRKWLVHLSIHHPFSNGSLLLQRKSGFFFLLRLDSIVINSKLKICNDLDYCCHIDWQYRVAKRPFIFMELGIIILLCNQ